MRSGRESLLGELKLAEEKYLLYVNKREEARIEDAMDQGGILNVTVAEEPRTPALPAQAVWVFGSGRRRCLEGRRALDWPSPPIISTRASGHRMR